MSATLVLGSRLFCMFSGCWYCWSWLYAVTKVSTHEFFRALFLRMYTARLFTLIVLLFWLDYYDRSPHLYTLEIFFLSLGKEPIKSSKRVISVASSCASVKTESLLLLPTDVGSFRWFRRWSLAGFLPSPHPTPPWVSWFRGLFSVTGPVSRNHPLKWQCDLERSTIYSALCSSPWIPWNISNYSHFCCRNGAREVMRLSNDAMFSNLLSQSLHSWP